MKPDPSKVKAVKNYPMPRNVKDVQSFIGLAGYYRKFSEDFAWNSKWEKGTQMQIRICVTTRSHAKEREGTQASATTGELEKADKETLASKDDAEPSKEANDSGHKSKTNAFGST